MVAKGDVSDEVRCRRRKRIERVRLAGEDGEIELGHELGEIHTALGGGDGDRLVATTAEVDLMAYEDASNRLLKF